MDRDFINDDEFFGRASRKRGKTGRLADRFFIEPFSLFNARMESWKQRKRSWIALGVRPELGRNVETYGVHQWASEVDNRDRRTDFAHGWKRSGGVSVFDPVLCEIMYRWFCAPGAQVVDPFAGGSVRGVVASLLGMRYWGCDLSSTQVEANRRQGDEIGCANATWEIGDATVRISDSPESDFLFTCPPYGSMEKYSDDPRDLSTMTYMVFLAALNRIVEECAIRLKQDRFAAVVVSDFRNRRGNYCGFVADTIKLFERNGLRLYNEMVLLTPLGTLPIRAGRSFEATRKVGKTHQWVLVFAKGSGRKAAQWCRGE